MAVKTKTKQVTKTIAVCPYCGQTKCSCMKLAGAYYIVMALTIAAFALSLFSIVTTAWIVAVLVALKGVMYLSQA